MQGGIDILSLKRLCYVMLVIITICAVFLLYNLNENRTEIVQIRKDPVEVQKLIEGVPVSHFSQPRFLVAGDPETPLYGSIYGNVCQLLGDLHLPFEERGRLKESDLTPEDTVLIFCGESIHRYADLQQLERYLENGGRMILAAGLAEGNEDAYLLPVLGITSKAMRINLNQFHFLHEFFPVQEKVMGYGDYNMSTSIKVRDHAEIYISAEDDKTPLVYTAAYGQGKTLVINGTLLSDDRCLGLLTAGMGALLGDFVYPVVGVETICLDNFPLVTNTDDAASLRLYGRTTEALVRDVVWPVLQGISMRSGFPYTSSVIAASTDESAFPAISDGLFSTMGKSALQFDVELAFASYHDGKGELHGHEKFLRKFSEVFQNYQVTSLVTTSDVGLSDTLSFLGDHITAVRGSLRAEDPALRFSQENGVTVFPLATSGTELEKTGLFVAASVYAGYGMLSHSLDVNDFIDVHQGIPVWDTEKKKLAEFEKHVLSRLEGLEPMTLSQTVNPVNSYLNLDYSWQREDESILIAAEHFLPGQAFLARIDGEVTQARGAEYRKLSEHWYMIRLLEPQAQLTVS